MINVEKIKKASELAKEMVNKGIAKDMDEAMEKVRDISNIEEIKKPTQKFEEEDAFKINFDKFKQRLDRVESSLNNFIEDINQRLKQIEADVEKLFNKINFLNAPVKNEPLNTDKESLPNQEETKPKKKDDASTKIQRRDEISQELYDIKTIFDNSNNKLMKRVEKND